MYKHPAVFLKAGRSPNVLNKTAISNRRLPIKHDSADTCYQLVSVSSGRREIRFQESDQSMRIKCNSYKSGPARPPGSLCRVPTTAGRAVIKSINEGADEAAEGHRRGFSSPYKITKFP